MYGKEIPGSLSNYFAKAKLLMVIAWLRYEQVAYTDTISLACVHAHKHACFAPLACTRYGTCSSWKQVVRTRQERFGTGMQRSSPAMNMTSPARHDETNGDAGAARTVEIDRRKLVA
jgi:hypothetical protein